MSQTLDEQGARQWLDRLGAEQNWRLTRVEHLATERLEHLAEALAHLAYAWNNDPEHVADLMGDDDMDRMLANAAACVLEVLDGRR